MKMALAFDSSKNKLFYTSNFNVFAGWLPGDYVKRQIERWAKQYEASKTQEIPAMDKLIDWLKQNLPENDTTTVVHGDFRSEMTTDSRPCLDSKALAERCSQLKPTRAKFSTWTNWVGYRLATHLVRVGSSWLQFDQAQIFALLEPRFPPLFFVGWLRGRLRAGSNWRYCLAARQARMKMDRWRFER